MVLVEVLPAKDLDPVFFPESRSASLDLMCIEVPEIIMIHRFISVVSNSNKIKYIRLQVGFPVVNCKN